MAIYYQIDKALKLVTTTVTGELTLQQCLDHHQKLGADPGFEPGFREFIDLGEATRVEMKTASILEISRTCPFGTTAMRALYTGDNLLYYGLARMFRAFAGDKHGEIMVFRKKHDARQWLGINAK